MNNSFIRFQPINSPLDRTAAACGINQSYQNTANQSSFSVRIPALNRVCEGLLLSGSVRIGSINPGPLPPIERMKSDFYTCNAVFPKNVGVHAILRTVTVMSGNGTILSHIPNYTDWVFRNARSAPLDKSPTADIGVHVSWEEDSTGGFIATHSDACDKTFLIKLRLNCSETLNLLTTGGLQVDLTFNSPLTVCTFPRIFFPDPDGQYANAGFCRPLTYALPYGAGSLGLGSSLTAGGFTINNLQSTVSISSGEIVQFELTDGYTPVSAIQECCFYVSANLLLVVADELITAPGPATVYECKQPIKSFLPWTQSSVSALPLPLGGYCVGDITLEPLVLNEASGFGWTTGFRTHACNGYEEWRFNSSLPGLTYAIPQNVLDAYAPTMPTNQKDIWQSDRFLQEIPYNAKLTRGIGQYYMGKTFIGATSITAMTQLLNSAMFYPAYNRSVSKAVQSECAQLMISFSGKDNSGAGSVISPNTTIVTPTDANSFNPSPAFSGDVSTYYAREFDSSVLPFSTRRVPLARTHFDSRTPYGVVGGSFPTGSRFLVGRLQARCEHQYNDGTQFKLNTRCPYPVSARSIIDTYTTAAVSAYQLVAVPLIQPLPYYHVPPKAPSPSTLNWMFTVSTFETRTLSDVNIQITPSKTFTPKPVNPCCFKWHEKSQASTSMLYLREQPLYQVPELYEGNLALRWNCINMGTVFKTKIQVPLRVVTESGSYDPSTAPNVRGSLLPAFPYAPRQCTAANRFVNRPCGDAGCVKVSTYLTPNGIMRNIEERKYISHALYGMPLSERLAYEQTYRGHGAIIDNQDTSYYYSRSNRIYRNIRPSDRYSIIPYCGVYRSAFDNNRYVSITNTSTTSTVAASGSVKPALYEGDRYSYLSEYPVFMTLSAQQLPTLAAPLSYPQTPEKQMVIEFDSQPGNFINVCAGGSVFTHNLADFWSEQLPRTLGRIMPQLGFAGTTKAVVRQLVYNPADMPAITDMAYAEGIPIQVPSSVSYDSYQSVTRPSTKNGPYSIDELTIYSSNPIPVGGLNIDHIKSSVRLGRFNAANMMPVLLPMYQPVNARFQSCDDYSLSLFSSISPNAELLSVSSAMPLSYNVYMYPMADGVPLRSVDAYFGHWLANIEQYARMFGGRIQSPHNALLDTMIPYQEELSRFAFLQVATAASLDNLPFAGGLTSANYGTPLNYTSMPALSGNASIRTLDAFQNQFFPSSHAFMLLATHNALGNTRLLSFNYQFKNAPLSSYGASSLGKYIRCPHAQASPQNENPMNFTTDNLTFTHTIDMFSMDSWILTKTGIVCVSKAFAR